MVAKVSVYWSGTADARDQDDGRDAFVLADSLQTDQHGFRAVRPADSVVIRWRELTRLDEDSTFAFNAIVANSVSHSIATILTCFNSPELPVSRRFGL